MLKEEPAVPFTPPVVSCLGRNNMLFCPPLAYLDRIYKYVVRKGRWLNVG